MLPNPKKVRILSMGWAGGAEANNRSGATRAVLTPALQFCNEIVDGLLALLDVVTVHLSHLARDDMAAGCNLRKWSSLGESDNPGGLEVAYLDQSTGK